MIAENQTPLPLVREWTNLIPNLWEDFAELAKRVPQVEPELADDAELAAALSIVQKRSAPNVPAFAKVNAAYELHALAIWRTHKIVYAYDSALAAELIEQADAWSDADELPVEALLHPPYKLPFISSPGMISEDFIGFFPYITRDVDTREAILCLTWVFTARDSVTQMLKLSGKTIGDCIRRTIRRANAAKHDKDARLNFDRKSIMRGLNLYLYICSQNADISAAPEPSYRPRTAGAPIRDKFREIQSYPTGLVIGSALRRARTESKHQAAAHTRQAGGHVRVHTRRGHWHHYWCGPKSEPDKRRLVLKWTHPILVGSKSDPDVTTIHPVK
ncbi:hypothetical protein DWZ82_13370 [Butyricicoccus sp. AF35-5AC]|uniref:AcrVA2 family anti-CRISPR protein n=1 Tax=Butyricicoccus sp. AF35-5AC TaxID=2292003 RepID=UPI000E4DB5EA|nr:hypothetical protein [Butyricicoccus sp. AF35-5AC]RHP12489.1 hypothetical protein DWZ82_13370 [Butyricicoccus sp. AF35-5AC]